MVDQWPSKNSGYWFGSQRMEGNTKIASCTYMEGAYTIDLGAHTIREIGIWASLTGTELLLCRKPMQMFEFQLGTDVVSLTSPYFGFYPNECRLKLFDSGRDVKIITIPGGWLVLLSELCHSLEKLIPGLSIVPSTPRWVNYSSVPSSCIFLFCFVFSQQAPNNCF